MKRDLYKFIGFFSCHEIRESENSFASLNGPKTKTVSLPPKALTKNLLKKTNTKDATPTPFFFFLLQVQTPLNGGFPFVFWEHMATPQLINK